MPIESARTKELRKRLEESIAQDKNDEWKSATPLTPEQFKGKWGAQLCLQPGCDCAAPVSGAKYVGFAHDLDRLVQMIIERTNDEHR